MSEMGCWICQQASQIVEASGKPQEPQIYFQAPKMAAKIKQVIIRLICHKVYLASAYQEFLTDQVYNQNYSLSNRSTHWEPI